MRKFLKSTRHNIFHSVFATPRNGETNQKVSTRVAEFSTRKKSISQRYVFSPVKYIDSKKPPIKNYEPKNVHYLTPFCTIKHIMYYSPYVHNAYKRLAYVCKLVVHSIARVRTPPTAVYMFALLYECVYAELGDSL